MGGAKRMLTIRDGGTNGAAATGSMVPSDGQRARHDSIGVAVQEVVLIVGRDHGDLAVSLQEAERGAHDPRLGDEERRQRRDRGQPGERAGMWVPGRRGALPHLGRS